MVQWCAAHRGSTATLPTQPAVRKWTLEYLEGQLTKQDVTVFRSSGDFLYHDGSGAGGAGYAWTAPSERLSVPFKAFLEEFRRNIAQEGRVPFAPPAPAPAGATDAGGQPAAPSPSAQMLAALEGTQEGSAPVAPAATGGAVSAAGAQPPPPGGAPPRPRVYMQQSLTDGVGAGLQEDFARFNWPLVTAIAAKHEWGPLTSNLLLLGQRGCVTPLHYDEQHNLFAQVRGRKLAVLAAPEHFDAFCPFPVGHPHDRQAQVNIRAPDTRRFPAFTSARFQHALLEPGDVLYIPSYWWHEIHSPREDTVSVNFWYRAGPAGTPTLPLSDPVHLMALRRNLEKLLGQRFGLPVSTRFFARLAGPEGITLGSASGTDRDIVATLLQLLTMVLAPSGLEPFVMELARGRFDLPRADAVGGEGLPPDTPLLRAAVAEAVAAARQPAAAAAAAGAGGEDVAQLTQALRRAAVTENVRAARQQQDALGHAMGVAGTTARKPRAGAAGGAE